MVDFVRFGDFGNDVCLVSDPYFLKEGGEGGHGQFLGHGTSLRLGMIFFLVNNSLSKNLFNTANRRRRVDNNTCSVYCLCRAGLFWEIPLT